jgi:hypothetical protein
MSTVPQGSMPPTARVGDGRRKRSVIMLLLVVVLLGVCLWATRDYWFPGEEPGGDAAGTMTLPPIQPAGARMPASAPAEEDEAEADEPAANTAADTKSGAKDAAKGPPAPASGAGQAR